MPGNNSSSDSSRGNSTRKTSLPPTLVFKGSNVSQLDDMLSLGSDMDNSTGRLDTDAGSLMMISSTADSVLNDDNDSYLDQSVDAGNISVSSEVPYPPSSTAYPSYSVIELDPVDRMPTLLESQSHSTKMHTSPSKEDNYDHHPHLEIIHDDVTRVSSNISSSEDPLLVLPVEEPPEPAATTDPVLDPTVSIAAPATQEMPPSDPLDTPWSPHAMDVPLMPVSAESSICSETPDLHKYDETMQNRLSASHFRIPTIDDEIDLLPRISPIPIVNNLEQEDVMNVTMQQPSIIASSSPSDLIIAVEPTSAAPTIDAPIPQQLFASPMTAKGPSTMNKVSSPSSKDTPQNIPQDISSTPTTITLPSNDSPKENNANTVDTSSVSTAPAADPAALSINEAPSSPTDDLPSTNSSPSKPTSASKRDSPAPMLSKAKSKLGFSQSMKNLNSEPSRSRPPNAIEEVPSQPVDEVTVSKSDINQSIQQLSAVLNNHPTPEAQYSQPMRRLQRSSTIKSFMEPKSSINLLMQPGTGTKGSQEGPSSPMAAAAAAAAAASSGPSNSEAKADSSSPNPTAPMVSRTADSPATSGKTSPSKGRIGVAKLRSLVLGARSIDEELGPIDDFEAARKQAQQVSDRLQKMKEEQQRQLQEKEAARKKKLLEDARREAELAARYGKARSLGFSSFKAGLTRKEYQEFRSSSPIKSLAELMPASAEDDSTAEAPAAMKSFGSTASESSGHAMQRPHADGVASHAGDKESDSHIAAVKATATAVSSSSASSTTGPSGKATGTHQGKRLSIVRTQRRSFDEGANSNTRALLSDLAAAHQQHPHHHHHHALAQFEHEIAMLLKELQSDDLIDKRFGWNRKHPQDARANHHRKVAPTSGTSTGPIMAGNNKVILSTSLDSLSELISSSQHHHSNQPFQTATRRGPGMMQRQRSLRNSLQGHKLKQLLRQKSFDANDAANTDAHFIPGFDDDKGVMGSLYEHYSGLIYRDPSSPSAWRDVNTTASNSPERARSRSPTMGLGMSRRSLWAGQMLNSYRPWSRPRTPDPFDMLMMNARSRSFDLEEMDVSPELSPINKSPKRFGGGGRSFSGSAPTTPSAKSPKKLLRGKSSARLARQPSSSSSPIHGGGKMRGGGGESNSANNNKPFAFEDGHESITSEMSRPHTSPQRSAVSPMRKSVEFSQSLSSAEKKRLPLIINIISP